jgi:putative hydrolase of the HAD superfamily
LTNGNSKLQNGKINRFNLASYFEFILIEEELGFGKPDSRVFKIALEKLDVFSKNVWMVGDNLVWDIQGAQESGIFAIWNDFNKNGLPENSRIKPDRIINNISELLK